MLTDGPFLDQSKTVGSIFNVYMKDLAHCLTFKSKDASRSCIYAAFESANMQVDALCQKPFSGDMVTYSNYLETWKCFFDRPYILKWLQTNVPNQINSRKNAALNLLNDDFAYYGKCLQKEVDSAIACRDAIHDELRNELKEQWRPLLTTTVDAKKCSEFHNQYYTARNNVKKPVEDFRVLICPWEKTPYDECFQYQG